MSSRVFDPKKIPSAARIPGMDRRASDAQSSDRSAVEKPGAPKRRSYRAGSFKVPVDDPSMMKGDRGELGRRFKKHLRGVTSRTPISDPDEMIPPRRARPVFLKDSRSVGSQSHREPSGSSTLGSVTLRPRILTGFGSVSSDDGGDDEGE